MIYSLPNLEAKGIGHSANVVVICCNQEVEGGTVIPHFGATAKWLVFWLVFSPP